MTVNFTNEEIKVMKSVIRIELEEEIRALNELSRTPASISRIKYLESKIEVLKSTLEKIN